MNEISWGIIGCGDVTEVKSGPAFSKVPGSRLQAVMRRDGAKAADYAARHGVPRWYANAADLLADPAVTAVYIATPPAAHEAYTLQALAAGKPVYVEKPMATSAAAARRMADAAQAAGIPLVVAHYRRAQPLFRKVKELLEGGAIGTPLSAELVLHEPHDAGLVARGDSPWRLDPAVSGGGLFWDLAPHALDLLLHWFGTPEMSSGASWNAYGTYEVPDTTAGIARLPGGVLATGRWCFGWPRKEDRCTLTGTEGTLRFSIFAPAPLLLERDGTETRFDFPPLPHVQEPMIAAVTAHFLGQGPNPAPAREGVAVMEWMEAYGKGS
ncbi:Gfo/Idh/MocA family oxidoreductase [Flaviaesturariibacter amylovorans]|uniref:Gfo/Idh/MocA family oxidoreductase n=1 Tax=Flaviaesturariibacter amylovorans TaxID=1084520 RepID=A0ABP8HV32_9BACT